MTTPAGSTGTSAERAGPGGSRESAGPPGTGPAVLDPRKRAERAGRARSASERLRAAGVTMVALCWVDNAGITRVKAIPLGRLERAAGWGIGMSPVFDVFLVNDDITASEHIGGPGRYGLSADGEAFAAGILAGLPALAGVGSPSVASYLRLVPSHWAGVFQCWGRENREAALRLVTGSAGEHDIRANLEVKCFDLAANPYLVTGSLIAAGLAGLDSGAGLPEEITGDPAGLPGAELDRRGIRRLPQSLAEATGCLENSTLLRQAMGDPLFSAFIAVRRAESELFAGVSPDDIAAQTRWRW